MLTFPNCKINIGLNVIEKRSDNFHNLDTVFYPIDWCDALEIIEMPNSNRSFCLEQSGNKIDGSIENNIIYKGWKIITALKRIPPIKVHLHKNIPTGAGLGGGSSDAAFLIKSLDKKFNLNFSAMEKNTIANQLGSDCSFFLENKPVYAVGKGNEFSEIKVDLSQYFILLVYPNIHSNTKEAYENLKPQKPLKNLKIIFENHEIAEWKSLVVNDFEGSIFKKYPEIKTLKETMYANGAIYASMSGSGSTVFGIFDKKPDIAFQKNYVFHLRKPIVPIL